MVARKEPTGWVQGIAISRSLFLRRKVASSRARVVSRGYGDWYIVALRVLEFREQQARFQK